VAGSVAWNSLPLDIRSFRTYIINFQKHAQNLFSPSYFTDCFAEYEQRTLYGALVVTPAMLLRRFIIIIIKAFVECQFIVCRFAPAMNIFFTAVMKVCLSFYCSNNSTH